MTIIQTPTHLQKCGELLPYYFFYHQHYFKTAIIIHDSTFIQKRLNFDKLGKNINRFGGVIPL